MAQLGVMWYLLLPLAIQNGRSSLVTIPLAAVISVTLFYLLGEKQAAWYVFIKKIIAFITAGYLLYALSVEAMTFIHKGSYWFILTILILWVLWMGLGKKNPIRESMIPPGNQGLYSLWTHVIVVIAVLLFISQIKNLDLSYAFQMKKVTLNEMIIETGELVVLNGPFWLYFGKGNRQKQCFKIFGAWAVMWCTFVILTAIMRYPLLAMSDVPFYIFGRSALWFSNPARMEVYAAMALWICMFFAIWESVMVLCQDFRSGSLKSDDITDNQTDYQTGFHKKKSNYSKTIAGILAICLLCIACCTGCGKQLAQKDILLVTDSNVLLRGENENKSQQELSHTRVLIIHDDKLDPVIQQLLSHTDISLQAKVAYSTEDISTSISKEKDEISQQLKKEVDQFGPSILTVINCCYSAKEQIEIPQVVVKDGKLVKIGSVLFKNGKLWKSSH